MMKDKLNQELNINDLCIFSYENKIEIVKITKFSYNNFGNYIFLERIISNKLPLYKQKRIFSINENFESLLKINDKFNAEITIYLLKN